MKLLAGVDGGATKTRVVIADQNGAPLGEGAAGPTNVQVVGVETAADNLAAALRAALASTPYHAFPALRLTLGVAGLDGPNDAPSVAAFITQALSRLHVRASWVAVNDAVIAWAGALDGEPGGIVISGSGAAAVAVNREGQIFHADGLGHWLGDDGSGFAIGRAGARAAARALEDRGPRTLLSESLLIHAGEPLAAWAARLVEDDGLAHRSLADFAPCVVDAAAKGDTIAHAILTDAGNALAASGASVLRRAGLRAGQVATVGSLFLHAPPLREAFCRAIARLLPDCQVIWPHKQPVEGALLLARSPALLPQDLLSVAGETES